MSLRYALVFLALAEALPAEYNLLHGPDPQDPMQAHIYQLDNGLTIYLTQNKEEPRFYAEIAVRAGSKHDPQDATGIAHYLEHMLFKGSQKIGTLDYEQEKVHLDRIEVLHWRTSAGEEVDFVIEAGDSLLPIEVKATDRPRLRDARHLRTFRKEYGDQARAGLLIHTGAATQWLGPGVLAAPWWKVL